MKKRLFIFLLISTYLLQPVWSQEIAILKGIVKNLEKKPVEDVLIYVSSENESVTTNSKGVFELKLPNNKKYTLTIVGDRFDPLSESVFLSGDTTIKIWVDEILHNLGPVEIHAEADAFGI